jgi:hypothetical protein
MEIFLKYKKVDLTRKPCPYNPIRKIVKKNIYLD